MIVKISDEQVAGCVHSHIMRLIKRRLRGRAAIATIPANTIPGNSRNNTDSVHFANSVIKHICNVKVADCIKSHPSWLIKPCLKPGNGSNDTGGAHFANAIVPRISNV